MTPTIEQLYAWVTGEPVGSYTTPTLEQMLLGGVL